jgi:DeoR/GlpR family transcriptional regulator of sugar metabolism
MGVCIDHGLTHPVLEEISVLKALMKISQEKYLIADSSKFGRVSLAKVADITAFNGLITDDKLPELYREFAESNDIEII